MDSEAQSQNLNEQATMDTSSTQPPAKKFRGPSRALKYTRLRTSQPPKIKAQIPLELGVVVGKTANQFVSKCSHWVKMYCPLDVVSWSQMPDHVLDQLYGKIKGSYEFDPGTHIDKALEVQCSAAYRKWRESLKKKYFTGKTLKRALANHPHSVSSTQWRWLVDEYWNCDKQKRRSRVNKENALSKKKIHSVCGAKSSGRRLHEMDVEEESSAEHETQLDPGASITRVPKYIKFWNEVKRHKDGRLDGLAENKLKEFQKLHEKEIEEKGIDNLTVDEAFQKELGYRSGYARGLGKGHPVLPPIGRKNGVSQLQAQIDKIKIEAKEWEARREQEYKERDAQREAEYREREAQKEEEHRRRVDQLSLELDAKLQSKLNEFMKNFQAQVVEKCITDLDFNF